MYRFVALIATVVAAVLAARSTIDRT